MRKFLLILLPFLSINTALACDICGCFMGVVPYDNQSSIAFMHRYRVFNGYRNYQSHSRYFPAGAYKATHGGGHDTLLTKNYSSADYESFKVFELRTKYFIHPRIELNVFASVVNNKSKADSVKLSYTGLGDPHFFVGYHIIRPKPEADLRMRWIVGAGVKLPSGNYYAKDENDMRLPFLMQPGTGSVDYFFYTTYMIAYKMVGLSTTTNYKLNGKNFYKEQIGNSFTNFASLFFRYKKKNWMFMASINSYYERTSGLYIHNVLQTGTEMNELMCGLGMDVYYKNIGLSIGAQRTVHQHNQSGELRSVGRFLVSLSYNFNQRKYLFKGKKEDAQ
ncbi:MAG: hypothetical protein KBG47_08220 [Bacteroidia bacterium]|nr:hypothetical protein [Bacteroidia bacterium]